MRRVGCDDSQVNAATLRPRFSSVWASYGYSTRQISEGVYPLEECLVAPMTEYGWSALPEAFDPAFSDPDREEPVQALWCPSCCSRLRNPCYSHDAGRFGFPAPHGLETHPDRSARVRRAQFTRALKHGEACEYPLIANQHCTQFSCTGGVLAFLCWQPVVNKHRCFVG